MAFNRIIPAEGDFPGAGDLGLADCLEQVIGRTEKSIRVFLEGLAQIDLFQAAVTSPPFHLRMSR